MTCYLKPCDQSNRSQIEALQVSKEQRLLIESNADSLKEADENEYWQPIGLYDDDLLVGFAMVGIEPEDGTVWLDRFMIAAEFQGKGYGDRFLRLIIQKIVDEYHCEKIYLSYLPDNAAIARFYSKIGFQETGKKDANGEFIMCLDTKF